MGSVKGAKIGSKLAFVREYYGQSALERVLASMSPSDRAELKIVLETRWYSIELYDRLVVAICKIAAGGHESAYRRLGQHSAEMAFSTTYRSFRGSSPADLISKMASMHALRNDPAEMKIVKQGDRHCTVRIVEPRSTIALCKMSRAFFVRALELSGVTNVAANETSCSGRSAPYCEFELTWM